MIKPGDSVRFYSKEYVVLGCYQQRNQYKQALIEYQWGFRINAANIIDYRNSPDYYDIINNIDAYIGHTVEWLNFSSLTYAFSTDIVGPRKVLDSKYFPLDTDFNKMLDTLISVGKQHRKMRICEISGDYTKIYVEPKND